MKYLIILLLGLGLVFSESICNTYKLGDTVAIPGNYESKNIMMIFSESPKSIYENQNYEYYLNKSDSLNLKLLLFVSDTLGKSEFKKPTLSKVAIVHDEFGVNFSKYKISSLPTLILTDKDGIVRLISESKNQEFYKYAMDSTIKSLRNTAIVSKLDSNCRIISEVIIKDTDPLKKSTMIFDAKYDKTNSTYIILDNECNYKIIDEFGNIIKRYKVFKGDSEKLLYSNIQKENMFADHFYFTDYLSPTRIEMFEYNLLTDTFKTIYTGVRNDDFNPDNSALCISDSEFVIPSKISFYNPQKINNANQFINIKTQENYYFGEIDSIYTNNTLKHFYNVVLTMDKSKRIYYITTFSDSLKVYDPVLNTEKGIYCNFSKYYCKECKDSLSKLIDGQDEILIKQFKKKKTSLNNNCILIDETANNIYVYYSEINTRLNDVKHRYVVDNISKGQKTILLNHANLPIYIDNDVLCICDYSSDKMKIVKMKIIK